jgi:ankyrin repeat protein
MKIKSLFLILLTCLVYSNVSGQKFAKAVLKKRDYIKAQELVDKGYNVHEHFARLCNPLLNAIIWYNDIKMVDFLLKNNFQNDTCLGDHTLLGIASSAIFEKSVEYSTSNPEQNRYFIDYTPLFYAIKYKRNECVIKYDDYQYDFNKKLGGAKYSYPLLAAAEFGNKVIFDILLKKNVDVTVKDSYGKNGIMYSSSTGNLEFTKLLLEKGCPTNDTSNTGYTPLMFAANFPGVDIELIELLVNNGADVNFITKGGESAFSLACLKNNRHVALNLLSHGAIPCDTKLDIESNSRMNHFLGDHYLSLGDLEKSKIYYSKAKQFYTDAISPLKEKLNKINQGIAMDFIISAATTAAITSLSISQAQYFSNYSSMGFSNSQITAIGINNAENFLLYSNNYNKLNANIYEKNPDILYYYEKPNTYEYEPLKIYYKYKISQFQNSIKLIDAIMNCIDKGLTSSDLDACVSEIKLMDDKKQNVQ